jgi:hypothetical protein
MTFLNLNRTPQNEVQPPPTHKRGKTKTMRKKLKQTLFALAPLYGPTVWLLSKNLTLNHPVKLALVTASAVVETILISVLQWFNASHITILLVTGFGYILLLLAIIDLTGEAVLETVKKLIKNWRDNDDTEDGSD